MYLFVVALGAGNGSEECVARLRDAPRDKPLHRQLLARFPLVDPGAEARRDRLMSHCIRSNKRHSETLISCRLPVNVLQPDLGIACASETE